MSTNCLLKELKANADNPNILILGECFITIESVVEQVTNIFSLKLTVSKAQTISIVSGNGHFFNANAYDGGKKLDIAANTATVINTSSIGDVISIPDKYSILDISAADNGPLFSLDKNTVKALSSLHTLYSYKAISGVFDIKSLNDSPNLRNIRATGSGVSGDISNLADKTELTSVYINTSSISGNLGSLKNLTALETFNFNGTQIISSDVSNDLKYLVSLAGNINVERNNYSNAGDLALVPSKVTFVKFNQSSFIPAIWTTRANTAYFLSMANMDLGNYLDAMLDNQVNLTHSGSIYAIEIYGNITTNTLTKAKALLTAHSGLTLKINRVTVTQETTELPDNPNNA